MKNKITKFAFLILINLFITSNLVSEEINFEANLIELIDKDNRIIAKKNVKIFNQKETIYANEMDYDKTSQILKAKGNIKIENLGENIEIFGDELTYLIKKEQIILNKNVKISFEKDLFFNTEKVIYDKTKKQISVDNTSKFKDKFGNIVSSKESEFLLEKKLLKLRAVKMTDELNNEYHFNNAIVNIMKNEIIADGIKIDFFKGSFGNKENDPRLRGNYFFGNNNQSEIKKGVFTTCKKNSDKCPPWQFRAQEIKHDKSKKTIYYKNAWLDLYDKPVIYFPKFFHPDPTVKRQSGFLMPRFESSSSLGDSFSVPYFKVISESKDLTFSPKIFGDNEVLVQNEYRQENKNSSHISDISLKRKESNSKTHFFSNTLANLDLSFFESSELEFNVETTSDDNYLKSHKIKSEITNNNSLLNNTSL